MVILIIAQRLGGCNDDGLAGVNAHGIQVLHVAHHQAVVLGITPRPGGLAGGWSWVPGWSQWRALGEPHDFVLQLLPSLEALIDDHLPQGPDRKKMHRISDVPSCKRITWYSGIILTVDEVNGMLSSTQFNRNMCYACMHKHTCQSVCLFKFAIKIPPLPSVSTARFAHIRIMILELSQINLDSITWA